MYSVRMCNACFSVLRCSALACSFSRSRVSLVRPRILICGPLDMACTCISNRVTQCHQNVSFARYTPDLVIRAAIHPGPDGVVFLVDTTACFYSCEPAIVLPLGAVAGFPRACLRWSRL